MPCKMLFNKKAILEHENKIEFYEKEMNNVF